MAAVLACAPSYREGLPPQSPFAESVLARPALLPQGFAVGDVTADSAVLWFRTDGTVMAQAEWEPLAATTGGGAATASAKTPRFQSGPETDFTRQVRMKGLSPATRYRVRILIEQTAGPEGRREMVLAAQGEFTTLPDASVSAPVTFAWSGDLGGQQRCRIGADGYPIFNQLRRQALDFFLFLGDTIYSDDTCPSPPNEPGADFKATTLEQYRLRHRYQRDALALRRFLETVPVYVVWDDHEVKNDFSGPFEPQTAAGRQALRDYWPIASPPDDPQRLYRSVRYGADLELFILDTRQYRSLNTDPDGPDKTMLGSAQLQWLLDGLAQSTATWKVIATSVPLSIPKGKGTTGRGFDGWAGGLDGTGFERERQILVEAILTRHLKNVVFLAGDVHYVQANAYDPNGDGVTDFHEFVAGPLSAAQGRMTLPNPTLKPTTLIHEGGYYNFGLVRVTPSSFDVTVVDEKGVSRFTHHLSAQ